MPVNDNNELLFNRSVRLNAWLFSSVLGLASGSAIALVTALALAKPDHAAYLSLLSVFLPGYTVSVRGMLIGFFWCALIGALCGALIYLVYIRRASEHPEKMTLPSNSAGAWTTPTLVLDGHSLGIGLGVAVGVLLFAATTWLVLRGTASKSVHAALLAYYLPGYRVSIRGGALGAAEVFVIAYGISRLFAAVYNQTLALTRNRRSS